MPAIGPDGKPLSDNPTWEEMGIKLGKDPEKDKIMWDGKPNDEKGGEQPEYYVEGDPRWLRQRPIDELRGYCKKIGASEDGTHQELVDRLIDAHDLYEDDQGEEQFEQEEFYKLISKAKDKHDKPKKKKMHKWDIDTSEEDSDEEEMETIKRHREHERNRRELGAIRNDRFRRDMEWKERIAEAEKLKASANGEFKKNTEESNERALSTYLAAIWLLKPDNPRCPDSLSAGIWAFRPDDPMKPKDIAEFQYPLEGFEVERLIGCGSDKVWRKLKERDLREGSDEEVVVDEGSDEERKAWATEWLRWGVQDKELREVAPAQGRTWGKKTMELRLALHLNVAAATIKFDDALATEAACQFVLKRAPDNPKARYRLACAQSGKGDLKKALVTLASLLKLPGQAKNAEARELYDAIKEQEERAENGEYDDEQDGYTEEQPPEDDEDDESDEEFEERRQEFMRERLEEKKAAEAADAALDNEFELRDTKGSEVPKRFEDLVDQDQVEQDGEGSHFEEVN